MPKRTKPRRGVTDHDLTHESVRELLALWRLIDTFDDLQTEAFKIRDTFFDTVTREIGVEGENRGLSTRLAVELGLSDSGMKSVKHRARTRDTADERRAAAVLAAVRSALKTYEELMGDEADSTEHDAA